MNQEQRAMARHALGLNMKHGISYRNRYVAAVSSWREREWDDLCARGLAIKGAVGVHLVDFCLTEAGARAALDPGEKLDCEDFPPLPATERT